MWMLVILLGGAVVAERKFTKTPTNTTAMVGGKVVLRCGVQDSTPELVQWLRDGFGLGLDPSLPGYPRYTMEGGGGGVWDLTIDPVAIEDDATFQCQAPPLASTAAHLHVEAPPSFPVIRQSGGELKVQVATSPSPGYILVQEGRPTSLTCQSQGRPEPDLQWAGARGRVMRQNDTARRLDHTNLYQTTSILTWIPSRAQDNSTVSCTASSSSQPSIFSEDFSFSSFPSLTSSVLLRLWSRPRVQVSLVGGAGESGPREGDSLTFRCSVTSFPPVTTVEWRVRGNTVQGVDTHLLRLERVGRGLQGATVQCRAGNGAGEGRGEQTLNLLLRPVLTVVPVSQTSKEGGQVQLSCRAQANPAPAYNWTLDGEYVSTGPDLLVLASSNTEGSYRCHVWVEGFPIVSSPAASLRVLRPPVVSLPQVQSGEIGGGVVMECKAVSVSNTLSITWSQEGRERLSTRHQVTVTKGEWEEVSELRIDRLRKEDFGRYGCLARSEEGPEFREYRVISLEEMEETISVTVIIITATFLVLTLCLFGLIGYIIVLKKSKSPSPSPLAVLPPPPPVAQNRYGERGRLNNDEALLADLLNTKVKGVPGDLLVPAIVTREEAVCLDSRSKCSRRSSLLSSTEEPQQQESIFSDDKVLSPGYYCQTSPPRPSPPPSTVGDSGIYSPPTSILPWLDEETLPKIMKSKDNWADTSLSVNKVDKVETSV